MLATRIGIVLCRVGAAVLIVQAARSLGYMAPALVDLQRDFWPDVVMMLVMVALPALAAAGLWILAPRISAIPGAPAADTDTPAGLDAVDVVATGTLLIGMYVAVQGLISGVSTEISAIMISNPDWTIPISVSHAAARATWIAEVVLGALLIVGRGSIARLLLRARYAGTGAN